ncbi:MAG: arabinan endo-1,5-alpha-L-arabinosidase [Planctomycetes bacterium]|nr:arabinan endo-1,5-alpha-L-arabinosidase [Planctomycetota bacterium]
MLYVLLLAAASPAPDARVHDPSTIIKCKDTYWVFHTGRGCRSKSSKDLVRWEEGPPVFRALPDWVRDAAPRCRGDIWAPDIIFLGDRYLLYYSVSSWGSRASGIGLATNPTLDPKDPRFRWTDRGLVIRSRETDDFNAIDPAIFRDTDGTLWLTFGSYWSGIKLLQLDPRTGKRLEPAAPPRALAWNESIEAPFLHKHDGFYYLFVNWGSCCRGIQSRYNIRIGRSPTISGPYLDRDGKDMREGGGSLLLGPAGRFIGPGHAGVFAADGVERLSFHFYDGEDRGRAKLGLRELRWEDGWPVP